MLLFPLTQVLNKVQQPKKVKKKYSQLGLSQIDCCYRECLSNTVVVTDLIHAMLYVSYTV